VEKPFPTVVEETGFTVLNRKLGSESNSSNWSLTPISFGKYQFWQHFRSLSGARISWRVGTLQAPVPFRPTASLLDAAFPSLKQFMTRASLLRTSIAQLLMLAALTACGETGPSEQLPPAAVTNVTGAPLTGPAGAALAERVVIRVADADGSPLPGVPVTFSVSATGASVDPANAVTDDRGEARTRWTLGRTPGQQTLTVTAAGSTSIQITATAGPPQIASLAANAGNNQSGTAGSNLPTAPSVVARDASNNAVEGVTVFFTVISGGGSVTSSSAVTNAQGIASAGTWRLGPATGTHLLSAQVPQAGVAGNPVVFTATANAGSPVSLTALSATTQTTPVGQLVTSVPSVIVRDAAGNPAAGVSVIFSLTSGGGQLTGGTQTTNAQGIATIGSWRVGSNPGPNTLTATASGLTPVTFTANGTAGAPVLMEKTLGDNQTGQVNRAVAIAPQVRVVDAAGNGVGGVAVTFAVASGDGSVVIGGVTTGVDGKATVGAWILGSTPGPNTLTASANGLTPVTFTATATGGTAVAMLPLSQVTQSGVAGQQATSPPSVVVRDAQGNPVGGVTVNFNVTQGGGSISGGTQITGTNGVATVNSWTFGPLAGANAVVASASGLPNVTFNATTTGIPTQVVLFNGNNQVAVSGTTVAIPPSVRVTDGNGQGVGNVPVTFSVGSGGGSVTGGSAFTDATGVATVGSWTLGSGATQTLTASAGSLAGSPVSFSATSATQVVITQQPPSNTTSGANFNVVVELRTANNSPAPVTGYPLTISILSGAGTLNAGGTLLTVNTVAGVATFNVNIVGGAGSRTLAITSATLPTVVTISVTLP
jgi:adhesin/invasin